LRWTADLRLADAHDRTLDYEAGGSMSKSKVAILRTKPETVL